MSKNKNLITSKKMAAEKEKRYLHSIVRGYVIFVLAVFPLIVGTEGYDDIIFSKAQIYWSVTLIFLLVFVLFYLAHKLGQKKAPDGVKWYKKLCIPDWAIIAFLIIITISSILSPYQNLTWLGTRNRSDGWLTMFCMLASYFPVSRWYKAKRLDFAIFAISSAIFCIIGYLQFFGYDFMKLFPYNRPPYADGAGNPFFSGFSIHFRSTIGNIDFVSAYVCMAVLAFGALYIKTKGPWRILFIAASVMNYIMMLIGDADAGKIGVLGAMVLLAPYWFAKRESTGRALILSAGFGISYTIYHWFMMNKIMPFWGDDAPVQDLVMRDNYSALPLKPILAVSLVSLAVGLAILFLIKQWAKPKNARLAGVAVTLIIIACGLGGVEVIGKKLPQENIIHQAREVMHGNMEDNFGTDRGYVWTRALSVVPNQPLFGTGQDTFEHALGEEIQADAKERHGVIYDKAHNDFIQILLCNGIFGLIAYIVLIISLIVFSVRPAFDDDILLMAFAAALAYLGQSLFGVDSITVTPIFWLMIAIVRNRQLAAKLENA